MAQELQKANLDVMSAQAHKARTEAASQTTQNEILGLERNFMMASQPIDLRMRIAQMMQNELLLPGMKNTASFESRIGNIAPGLGANSARLMMELLKTFKPGR